MPSWWCGSSYVATSLLLAVIIVCTIVLGLVLNRYSKFSKAVEKAVMNNLSRCELQKQSACRLIPQMNFAESNEEVIRRAVGNAASRHSLGLWCADAVARIELLFYKTNGLTTVELPPLAETSAVSFLPGFVSDDGVFPITFLFYKGKKIGYAYAVRVADMSPPQDILIVAFRGTATEQEWRTDFMFGQIDSSLSTAGESTRRMQISDQSEAQEPHMGVDVHEGFLGVYESVSRELDQAVELFVRTAKERADGTQTTVVMCGHSLGGAVASVASLAQFLKQENDSAHPSADKIHCVTFGAPRSMGPLSSDIQALLDKDSSAFWQTRYVNSCDLIPAVPLSVMPNTDNPGRPFVYQHLSTSVRVNTRIEDVYFSRNELSLAYNHLLFQYIHFLHIQLALSSG